MSSMRVKAGRYHFPFIEPFGEQGLEFIQERAATNSFDSISQGPLLPISKWNQRPKLARTHQSSTSWRSSFVPSARPTRCPLHRLS